MSNWNNKVVLITGGANGIGAALVKGYASMEANVYFVDMDREAGSEMEIYIKQQGQEATYLYGDVSKEGDVLKVMDTIREREGEIHVLVNNAGVSKFIPLDEITFNQWNAIIQTNLTGSFLFSKHGSRLMGTGAAIVNIASTRAAMSEPDSEAYAASKGGIVSLTHALAASFSKNTNIRVNAISPGWIETGDYESLRSIDHDQHFSKRVGRPEDIFRACLYLTDPSNDFITGENLTIDGGMTKKMIYHH